MFRYQHSHLTSVLTQIRLAPNIHYNHSLPPPSSPPQTKSPFIYIAGGVAGSVVFLIILVLLVWMICLRSAKKHDPKKLLPPATSIDPAAQGVS